MNFSCLTEEEVRYKYRKADNKEWMARILADLTCSSEREMKEFLGYNITVAKTRKRTYLDKELVRIAGESAKNTKNGKLNLKRLKN